MKVGILTFQAANNYGAFLQCYALYKKLNEFEGVDAEIIDYICPAIENDYKPEALLKGKRKTLKNLLVFCARMPVMIQVQKRFQASRDELFNFRHKRVSRNTIASINREFDTFIVGSDQIWNAKLTGDDRTYFLDFVEQNHKKNSYAVSIGDFHYNANRRKQLEEDLKAFHRLSVREESSARIVSEITGRSDVVTCIDPVFLYSKVEWEKILTSPKEKEYILLFHVGNPTESIVSFAKEIAQRKGKNLLLLSDKDIPYKHMEVKHLYKVDPREFLGYISRATCVITNSFHATAFSIILHTPFYVNTDVKRNERIINLLNITGLQSRTLEQGKNEMNADRIDWYFVDNRLSASIKESTAYLEQIVSDGFDAIMGDELYES